MTLLHDLVSLELDFFVVNLLKLKLCIILILIKLYQWLKITSIIVIFIGIYDVIIRAIPTHTHTDGHINRLRASHPLEPVGVTRISDHG